MKKVFYVSPDLSKNNHPESDAFLNLTNLTEEISFGEIVEAEDFEGNPKGLFKVLHAPKTNIVVAKRVPDTFSDLEKVVTAKNAIDYAYKVDKYLFAEGLLDEAGLPRTHIDLLEDMLDEKGYYLRDMAQGLYDTLILALGDLGKVREKVGDHDAFWAYSEPLLDLVLAQKKAGKISEVERLAIRSLFRGLL